MGVGTQRLVIYSAILWGFNRQVQALISDEWVIGSENAGNLPNMFSHQIVAYHYHYFETKPYKSYNRTHV